MSLNMFVSIVQSPCGSVLRSPLGAGGQPPVWTRAGFAPVFPRSSPGPGPSMLACPVSAVPTGSPSSRGSGLGLEQRHRASQVIIAKGRNETIHYIFTFPPPNSAAGTGEWPQMMSHNMLKKKKQQKKRGKFLREKSPIWCVTAAEERAGVSGAHCSSTNCPEERMHLDSLIPARFKALCTKVNTIISPSWETSQDIWEERGNCNRSHASPLLQHPPSK